MQPLQAAQDQGTCNRTARSAVPEARQCDEAQPICANCVKHREECSYSTARLEKAGLDSDDSRVARKTSSTTATASDVLRHPSQGFTNGSTNGPFAQDNVLELELMHHFSTSTYRTTTSVADWQLIFQTVVPQLGFSHSFVLHGVFAIAAAHLAHLRPHSSQYYIDLSSSYHAQALKMLNPALPNAIRTDCQAVFAFSSLMSVYSFARLASHALGKDSSGASSSLLPFSSEWITLTRGVASILVSSYAEITSGPFALFIMGHDPPEGVQLSSEVNERLDCLSVLWKDAASYDADMQKAFIVAVERMKVCFLKLEHMEPGKCEVSAVLSWPAQVTGVYMDLLSEQHPVALVVLAHWLVALHKIKHFWWIGNGPARMMASIAAELPDSWHAWIQWPSNTITPDPSGNTAAIQT